MDKKCRGSETSSTLVTRRTQVAHNFEVTGFSLLDGIGAGKHVSSSTFSAGGHEWNIRLYPDGWKEEDKAAYLSVFLHLFGGAVGARVKFSLILCLADDKGNQVSSSTSHTFDSIGDYWGWAKFVKKSKLQELLLPKDNDSFTIRCVLTLIDDTHTEDVSTVVVPRPNLHQDLTRMLKSGEGADVTFSVGGQLFPAHKWMLAARSMVFKAELFGSMKEKDAQCIKIDDVEPDIFDALLYFVYSDSLPDDCSNVEMQHLLVAADRYGLDRLRIMCEAKLCQEIDVQTVATTLVLAEQHHCTQLKDACLGFIASRNTDTLDEVMKTDGFKHLLTSCPLVMKEILDKVAAAGRQ